MKPLSRISRFPRPEDGLRAVVERAPQAEALAASWIEVVRPTLTWLYLMRRRLATITVMLMAVFLFVHVMFGANGMVVYKQKRADYQALKKEIDHVQTDNDRYTRKIQGLKGDQKAIEKEAREQLGYAKPGEYVYVAPVIQKPSTPANHSAKK